VARTNAAAAAWSPRPAASAQSVICLSSSTAADAFLVVRLYP
jgi:hypothetical protein